MRQQELFVLHSLYAARGSPSSNTAARLSSGSAAIYAQAPTWRRPSAAIAESQEEQRVGRRVPHLDGDRGPHARRVEAGHLLASLLVAQQALERRHDQVVEVALVRHVLAELLRHSALHALLLRADEAVQQNPACACNVSCR